MFARSARFPWPTSRRPGPLSGLTSPTENPGKMYLCINLFVVCGSTPSSSWAIPGPASVTADKIWVCPLVNTAEPCALGRTPTSHQIGRTSSTCLPSALTPSFTIIALIILFSRYLNSSATKSIPVSFIIFLMGCSSSRLSKYSRALVFVSSSFCFLYSLSKLWYAS